MLIGSEHLLHSFLNNDTRIKQNRDFVLDAEPGQRSSARRASMVNTTRLNDPHCPRYVTTQNGELMTPSPSSPTTVDAGP